MDNQPKKRGRKFGSKNKPKSEPNIPKKRGRKPNEKIIINENPIFAKDTMDVNDLILKLNTHKNNDGNNLSFEINDDENLLKFKDIPNNTNICWNCIHPFYNIVHGLPINYSKEIFHTIGSFCSIECMCRYAVDNYNEDIYNLLPIINIYNNKINNKITKIKLAPDKLLLNIFGGEMNIDEYRENNNILYDLKMPIIIPLNYNINKYGLKKNNNLSDLKLYRKKSLYRNKDNISNKMNLEL